MHLRPLQNTTLIVVAMVYGFALWMASLAGLLGIPLRILVTLSLWRYGYDVLRRFAQGRHVRVPAPSIESMSLLPDRGLVLHCLFFVSFFYLLVSTPLLGDSVGAGLLRIALLGCLGVIFPASAALLGMGGSVGGALHPLDIVACARTFGRDYALLLGACLALLVAASTAQAAVAPLFGWFAGLVSDMAIVWTFLALFALIGAAIHEHRFDFAIPGEHEPEEELVDRQRRRDWQRTIDHAYAAFRSDLPAKGHATLKELLDRERHSLAIYQYVFDQLMSWADKTAARHFAAGYIGRLLDAGLEHEALDLFASCRRQSGGFVIDARSADALVSYARSIGRHGVADDLMDPDARLPAEPT